VREQIELLEEVGDHLGLAEAWEAAATNQTWLGRTAAAAADYDRAEAHARESGRWRILRRIQAMRIVQEAWGHRDTATGIEHCNSVLAETVGTIVEPYALGLQLDRSHVLEHFDHDGVGHLRFFDDVVQLLARVIRIAELAAKHAGHDLDAGERVLDFVRDGRGHFAERGEAIAEALALFELLDLCQVFEKERRAMRAALVVVDAGEGIADRLAGVAEPKLRAIG